MKTLIFILAAALASPALGDGNTTTTETTSTSTTTSSPGSASGSGSMSGSGTSTDATTLESESVDSQDSSLSGSASSDYESGSSMSGSSTDSSLSGSSTSSDSSMSGTSSDYQSGSATSGATSSDPSLSGSGSNMGATTTTPSTTDTSSSLSGAATAPATSAPAAAPSQTTNVIIPPASATAAPAAPPEQASRTYREEDEDRGLRPGGFYLEPAVLGSQQENDFEGANAAAVGAAPTTDANSFGLDLKLGGHINESFFLAADARYERATLQDEAFEDTDADVYNWGPVIGFQAPKYGLRAWGTYVVDGIYNPESAANGVDLEFKNPYGWRGGIGVRFEAVSVNLEYEDLTYRTTDIESFGALANPAAADVDFSQRGASLSLSFPVEL